jgi:hypothetical protein
MPEIQAYDHGLVDPGYLGFDDVKRDLPMGKDWTLNGSQTVPIAAPWIYGSKCELVSTKTSMDIACCPGADRYQEPYST